MGQRITIYLDADVKEGLERASSERGSSEAALVRSAISEETGVSRRRVPYLGIFEGEPDLSSRTDEFLKGFGRAE